MTLSLCTTWIGNGIFWSTLNRNIDKTWIFKTGLTLLAKFLGSVEPDCTIDFFMTRSQTPVYGQKSVRIGVNTIEILTTFARGKGANWLFLLA